MRILAVADEVDRALWGPDVRERAADLIVACGDLPFDYLEYLLTMLSVPLLFVPGNHDPDLNKKPRPALVEAGAAFRSLADELPPGPQGGLNADGRVLRIKGLRIGGLGGSPRYSEGPNQYTEAQMARRVLALELRARLAGGLDVLVTHAPPWGWATTRTTPPPWVPGLPRAAAPPAPQAHAARSRAPLRSRVARGTLRRNQGCKRRRQPDGGGLRCPGPICPRPRRSSAHGAGRPTGAWRAP